ncbi:MAG: DUF3488 domain-containing protein [Lachnospiraceae bacterium]|nr:DUF3488 domain-containing protein [Lachnospiraceae bacterium]
MKSNVVIECILHVLQLIMQVVVVCCGMNVMVHGITRATVLRSDILLLTGLVVVIFYVTKSFLKFKNLAVLIHFGVVVGFALAVQGPAEIKFFSLLPILVLLVFSLARKTEKPFLPLDLGILIACYIMGGSILTANAQAMPYYATILYMLLFFIWFNLSNVNELMKENAGVSSFRPDQAMSVNSVILAIFVILALVVMVALPFLHVQTILAKVLGVVWAVVVKIIHLFDFGETKEAETVIETVQKTTDSIDQAIAPNLDMGEGNLILDLIVVVIGSIGLIFLVVLAISAIRSLKYGKSEGMDVKEFVRPVREKPIEHVEGGSFWKNLFGQGSTRDRIRTTYKTRVESAAKERSKKLKTKLVVSKTLVPMEVSKNFLGEDGPSDEFTSLYEEARYSTHDMDETKVERMKELYHETGNHI